MPIFKIPNQSIRWLFAELIIVVLGIVIGFQVSQWGESRGVRDLAAQNLVRAIAEAEFNSGQLRSRLSQLQDNSELIDSTLASLISCNEDFLQNNMESALEVLSFNFLPNLQSEQSNNLSRTEYADNFSSDFLEDLSRYKARHQVRINITKENYDAHFDWSLMVHMSDQLLVRNSAEQPPQSICFPTNFPSSIFVMMNSGAYPRSLLVAEGTSFTLGPFPVLKASSGISSQ